MYRQERMEEKNKTLGTVRGKNFGTLNVNKQKNIFIVIIIVIIITFLLAV